jgi:hypothetical protein
MGGGLGAIAALKTAVVPVPWKRKEGRTVVSTSGADRAARRAVWRLMIRFTDRPGLNGGGEERHRRGDISTPLPTRLIWPDRMRQAVDPTCRKSTDCPLGRGACSRDRMVDDEARHALLNTDHQEPTRTPV